MAESITKEDLTEILEELLHKKAFIEEDSHKLDHEFIALMREKFYRRQAMWERFKMSFIGTVATGFVAVFYWIGKLIWDAWHQTGGNHP